MVYEKPQMKIEIVEEDVICTSGGLIVNPEGGDGGIVWPWGEMI